MDAAELLDNLLFEAYIKRKSTHLTQIIRDGILYAGCNWSSVVRPASVQGYVNELLLCMVFVHAEVTVLDCADNNGSLAMNFASPADTSTHRASSSSFKLTKRVFAALVNDILQTFLSCFRQVEQFGDGGGMLQAWLDFGAVLEVLRTTVEGMPETRGLVRLVQATVTGDSGGMRDELADDMIKHWLKACAVEFQCFTA